MSCNRCFEDYLAKCNDVINVFAQLPVLAPYESYTWTITDKFDNIYSGTFITDADGFWQIDVDDLPEGLLTSYSGDFLLQVQDTTCKPIKFKVAQEYDCISFHIRGGTFVKDSLGCEFTCQPNSAGQSLLVTFEDVETVTVVWAAYLATYGNSPTIQVYHLLSPGVYQLVDVAIQTNYTDGVLTSIVVQNGGIATGYVVIS